jgi:hypothetical protein
MDLRVLAIALPLWALIAPPICAAKCGPIHLEGFRNSVVEHAAMDGPSHCHGARVAAPDARLGEEHPASGDESSNDSKIECCDEITAEVAQQETSPRTNPFLRLPPSLAGSVPANFAVRTIARPCARLPSPYSRANPPLLI